MFGSGYLANIGIIPALVGDDDLVLIDELAHACLWAGARLSRAAVVPYRHAEVGHVEALLAELRGRHRHALIATDGVFSMDGDIAPLGALAALAQRHDAWLMTDDAHGLGVVGDGRGSSFVQGQRVDVPLQMGTLSKAIGGYGGYLCASSAVIELIRNRARTAVYSTGLPPAMVAARDRRARPDRARARLCGAAARQGESIRAARRPAGAGEPDPADRDRRGGSGAGRLAPARGAGLPGDRHPAADGAGADRAAAAHLHRAAPRRGDRTPRRGRAHAHPGALGPLSRSNDRPVRHCHRHRYRQDLRQRWADPALARRRAAPSTRSSRSSAVSIRPRWTRAIQACCSRALGRDATPAEVERISPWRFTAPLSPDWAARREGRAIDFAELVEFCRRAMAARRGVLLIEGIGGVMVPLDDRRTVLDLMSTLRCPVILVAGSYVGTISHTFTALEVLARRNLDIAAIVVSETAGSAASLEETVAAVAHFADVIPVVGIPRLPAADADHPAFARLAGLL